MSRSNSMIDDEISTLKAELSANKAMVEKKVIGAIHRLAAELKKSEVEIENLKLKLKRKETIIKHLQASLQKLYSNKMKLEDKLRGVDLAEMKKIKLEMNDLREEIKKLKAKNKKKAQQISQYKLLMDDMMPDDYEEDPDEEDGAPSEDSSGAEDIIMLDKNEKVDKEALLNDEECDSTDPEDSDFELDEKDKAKMKKYEKRREEAAKIEKEKGVKRVEAKDDEEESAGRDGRNDEAMVKRDDVKDEIEVDLEIE